MEHVRSEGWLTTNNSWGSLWAGQRPEVVPRSDWREEGNRIGGDKRGGGGSEEGYSEVIVAPFREIGERRGKEKSTCTSIETMKHASSVVKTIQVPLRQAFYGRCVNVRSSYRYDLLAYSNPNLTHEPWSERAQKPFDERKEHMCFDPFMFFTAHWVFTRAINSPIRWILIFIDHSL